MPAAEIPPLSQAPAYVAPLLPLALAVMTGITVDRYGKLCSTAQWVWLSLTCAALSMLLARRRIAGNVAVIITWILLAGGWHHYRWFDTSADDLANVSSETPRPVWVLGILSDVIGYRPGKEPDDKGITRAVLEISAVNDGGNWRDVSGRALMTIVGDRTDLSAGLAVQTAGSLARVAGPLNPGEFDYRGFLQAQGIRLRISIDDSVGVWDDTNSVPSRHSVTWLVTSWLGSIRAWSHARLIRGIDPESAPLAAALLLGRREGVDPDINDAFARTGTSHLLAISGLHMQVLAVALGGLFRLFGMSRRGTFAMVALATIAYALLVGLMPSVVRSAAMTVTYCLAGWLDRRSRPANTLALATLITLGLNPAHLFDIGCQLSFLAMGAIFWLAAPMSRYLFPSKPADPLTALEQKFEAGWRTRVRSGWRGLAQGLMMSTIVWLAALPLVALRFHIISPIGILLNIPLIPITSLALLASGLSLGLRGLWEPLGGPAAWVSAGLLRITSNVVRWGVAQSWGYTFVPEPSWWWVVGFYLCLGLATASVISQWKRNDWALRIMAGWIALGLALSVVPRFSPQTSGPPEAEILAVGHGLAVLIDTGGGNATLYDCGRMRDPSVGRRVVAPALWARGIYRLQTVVLSHADADHFNGLRDLLDRFLIDEVCIPKGFEQPGQNPAATELLSHIRARSIRVKTLSTGDEWIIGATHFKVHHPPRDWNRLSSDNARSIVLEISWNDRSVWLTGDLENEGLAEFMKNPPPADVDVFLSPHHGGRTANPPSLYHKIKPKQVVVSQRPPTTGSRDALENLDTENLPLARTWQTGAVKLQWSKQGIETSGFRKENQELVNIK